MDCFFYIYIRALVTNYPKPLSLTLISSSIGTNRTINNPVAEGIFANEPSEPADKTPVKPHYTARGLGMQRFPSKDIWEDSPSSLLPALIQQDIDISSQ